MNTKKLSLKKSTLRLMSVHQLTEIVGGSEGNGDVGNTGSGEGGASTPGGGVGDGNSDNYGGGGDNGFDVGFLSYSGCTTSACGQSCGASGDCQGSSGPRDAG